MSLPQNGSSRGYRLHPRLHAGERGAATLRTSGWHHKTWSVFQSKETVINKKGLCAFESHLNVAFFIILVVDTVLNQMAVGIIGVDVTDKEKLSTKVLA